MQPLAMAQGVLDGYGSTTAMPCKVEVRQCKFFDKLGDICGLVDYIVSVLGVATLTTAAENRVLWRGWSLAE